MQIPNIDFSRYRQQQPSSWLDLGQQVPQALTTDGFMTVTGIDVSDDLRNRMFQLCKTFFAQPLATKKRWGYSSAAENFGYQGVAEEYLAPGTTADLKEAFTMSNVHHMQHHHNRWPSEQFMQLAIEFHAACLQAAFRVLRALAAALAAVGHTATPLEPSGAAPHTDYGSITLLFQDGVEGLELRDKQQA